MSKIERDPWVRQQGNRNIDPDKVEQNPQARQALAEGGVSVSKLRQADENRDGVVDAEEAWKVADDFDSDGSRGSLIDVSAAGRELPAGKALDALGVLMQNREVQGEPRRPQPQANDEVLFVGMNNETIKCAGSKHEIQTLKNRGVRVLAITDSVAGPDKIRVGGRTYDLQDAGQRLAYAQTLGLPAEQTQKIADAIAETGRTKASGMDEMAQLAQVWARAERGEYMPSRMIIGGHHVSSAVWGDGNGRFTWDALKKLADAMPNAASQVEDLMIAACYSGGKDKEAKYRNIFPNLRTVWAYAGSSPDAGSGATIHQESWEKATRGRGSDIAGAAERLQRRGIRKSEYIYTGQHRPFSEVLAEVQRGERMFQQFFTGEKEVQSSQSGPLFEWYGKLQELLGDHANSMDPGQRDRYEAMRDVAVRLRFYNSHVRHKFEETYGDELRRGYRALGMDKPDFSSMTRGQAMTAIADARERYEAGGRPGGFTEALGRLNGLWNLDGQTIPETWI